MKKNTDTPTEEHAPHVFSLKLYLRMFVVLFLLFCTNVLIYKLNFSPIVGLTLLMTVATVQATLVALVFMELIHEDKYYMLTFATSVLFMLLFIFVSLAEIGTRSFFHLDEGAHMLRGFDQSGVYAPSGPVKSGHSE